MRKLIKALMIGALLWWPALQAATSGEATADGVQSELAIDDSPQEKEGDEGWSGFSIFVLVFVVSVLFVLSTATALTRMGGSAPSPTIKPRHASRSKKRSSLPKDEERFRL